MMSPASCVLPHADARWHTTAGTPKHPPATHVCATAACAWRGMLSVCIPPRRKIGPPHRTSRTKEGLPSHRPRPKGASSPGRVLQPRGLGSASPAHHRPPGVPTGPYNCRSQAERHLRAVLHTSPPQYHVLRKASQGSKGPVLPMFSSEARAPHCHSRYDGSSSSKCGSSKGHTATPGLGLASTP